MKFRFGAMVSPTMEMDASSVGRTVADKHYEFQKKKQLLSCVQLGLSP
jgi:hypothetical protein